MKIKFLPLLLTSYFLLLTTAFAVPVLAAPPAGNFGFDNTAAQTDYVKNGKPSDTIESLVGKIVTTFLSAIAIFFFVLMLYGGIRWMTAKGNEESVLKSKNIIDAAVIGLVIVLGARALAQFILEQLNK